MKTKENEVKAKAKKAWDRGDVETALKLDLKIKPVFKDN